MSLHFTRASLRMFAHRSFFAIAVAAMILSLNPVAFSQKDKKTQTQSGATNVQRMDIMRSKLEALKRSLDSAIAAMPAADPKDKTKDDGRERLRGLSKDTSSLLSEVNDLHAKEDKSEKYDASKLDGLETSVADLNSRVEGALQATAGARKATSEQTTAASQQKSSQKSHGRFLGVFPRKTDDKYAELTGGVRPAATARSSWKQPRKSARAITRRVACCSPPSLRLIPTRLIWPWRSSQLPIRSISKAGPVR